MKRLTKKALPIAFAAILVSQLDAQPRTAPKDSSTTGPAPAAKVQLSPEQMKKEAQALRDQVRADIQRVQYLQAKARKGQDIIKLTCVNDKFIQLKAQANLFDQSHRELALALDSNQRFNLYPRVTTAAAEVHKVREEADGCIGESELEDESANAFTGPDIIDDPTIGLPFDIEVEPPAYASPYI